MSELRRKTRDLLERAASTHEPTPSDRARVRRGVASKLAVGSAIGLTGLGLSGKVVAAVALAGVIGAGVLATTRPAAVEAGPLTVQVARPRDAKPARAPLAATATPPVLDAPPAPAPMSLPAPARTAATVATASAPAAGPRPAASPTTAAATPPLPSAGVAEELSLVRSAADALVAHDPARAIALLDEHERRFPGGVMDEEAQAERVVAVCDLGKAAEARALAARFVAAHPRSIHVARVRAACAEPEAP